MLWWCQCDDGSDENYDNLSDISLEIDYDDNDDNAFDWHLSVYAPLSEIGAL